MTRWTRLSLTMVVVGLVASCACGATPARWAATGPLQVHPKNPRYFTDGSGKAVYLTGAHTWSNLVDMGPSDPPPKFDFDAYLDWMVKLDHNFIRLWTWEQTMWDARGGRINWFHPKVHFAAPQPWPRTGPGKALDGKPKFDLSKHDPKYFKRLRTRVEAAGTRGIYVSIMLFEGWGMQFMPGAFEAHPLHPKNNSSGIGVGGKGIGGYQLRNKAVTAIQEAYARKVIETVNDLDNVLYEISNENHGASTQWQYHMIRFIKQVEKAKPKQHPVGMTFQYKGGTNKDLFDSPADWVSPNPAGGYRDNPPDLKGAKVVLADTDHLWGIGGNQAWVWKIFTRGLNPLFMDPYRGVVIGGRFEKKWDPVRRNLGYTLRYARRMDLAAMSPQSKLASTKFCLASPGLEYLVFLPGGGKVEVDLSAAKGELSAEWFNPSTGTARKPTTVQGGTKRILAAPFKGDAVLYIKTEKE